MALVLRGEKPASVIFHSACGTQYASAQITAFAQANGIPWSMGYTGICWDNALAESFFATLKTEFYYRSVWPAKARAVREVGAWIEDRYNRCRRHSALEQVSPVEFELRYSSLPAEVLLAAQPRVHQTRSRPSRGAKDHLHGCADAKLVNAENGGFTVCKVRGLL